MPRKIDKIKCIPTTGHIEIREVLDDGTFHRSVIEPGDDQKAAEMGITKYTKSKWTKEIRDKTAARKEADKKREKEQEAAAIKAKEAKQKDFDDAVKKAVVKIKT